MELILLLYLPAIIYGIFKGIVFIFRETDRATDWIAIQSKKIGDLLPPMLNDEDCIRHAENFSEIGKHELALDLYTKAIALNPLPNYFKSRAKTKLLLSDKCGALNDYNKVLKNDPCAADTYLARGSLNCEMRNYEAAIQDWNKAANLKSITAINLLQEFNGSAALLNFLHTTKVTTPPHKYRWN